MLAANGPGRGQSTLGAPPELVPGLRWRRIFPGDERQLRVLRSWLASLLPQSPARDDLTVVATELACNTIKHTATGRGGGFSVEIWWLESVIRVAVGDDGGPTEPQVIEDPEAEHGRGLLLVRGLSVRTGVYGDHRGRRVWADVRWDTSPLALTAADPSEAAIRDGEAALARRFPGIPAWFGRSTLQWWALPESDELVSAPSAQELTALLHRLGAEHANRASAERPHDRTDAPRDRRRSQERHSPLMPAEPGSRPGKERHKADVEHHGGRGRPGEAHGVSRGRAQALASRPRPALAPSPPISGAA